MFKTLISASSILVVALTVACGEKPAPGAPAKTAEPAKRAEPPKTAEPPVSASADAPPGAPADAGAVAGSCMNSSGSQCTDYLDTSLDAAAAKGMCDLISGTFTAATACPATNKLGRCALAAAMRKRLSFYSGGEDGLTAALAEEECKSMSGTWAP